VQLVKRTVNTIPINTLSNTQPKLKTMTYHKYTIYLVNIGQFAICLILRGECDRCKILVQMTFTEGTTYWNWNFFSHQLLTFNIMVKIYQHKKELHNDYKATDMMWHYLVECKRRRFTVDVILQRETATQLTIALPQQRRWIILKRFIIDNYLVVMYQCKFYQFT